MSYSCNLKYVWDRGDSVLVLKYAGAQVIHVTGLAATSLITIMDIVVAICTRHAESAHWSKVSSSISLANNPPWLVSSNFLYVPLLVRYQWIM